MPESAIVLFSGGQIRRFGLPGRYAASTRSRRSASTMASANRLSLPAAGRYGEFFPSGFPGGAAGWERIIRSTPAFLGAISESSLTRDAEIKFREDGVLLHPSRAADVDR